MNKIEEMEIKITKPPLGLVPREVHELERIKDIVDAIERYTAANMLIPKRWVEELKELLAKYLIYEKIT